VSCPAPRLEPDQDAFCARLLAKHGGHVLLALLECRHYRETGLVGRHFYVGVEYELYLRLASQGTPESA
jgi:hypothetical protein